MYFIWSNQLSLASQKKKETTASVTEGEPEMEVGLGKKKKKWKLIVQKRCEAIKLPRMMIIVITTQQYNDNRVLGHFAPAVQWWEDNNNFIVI